MKYKYRKQQLLVRHHHLKDSMAYSNTEQKPWDDDDKCYSSESYSDDSPILSYRYDKNRHSDHDDDDVMEKRERRSTFSLVAKFSMFCTAVILFCVLMYIPLYTKANYTMHQGLVEGWSMDTSRDTKIYVLPHNITMLHEPKHVCTETNRKKSKLFLLVIVCSATSHFAEREAIRKTWGNYQSYRQTSKVFHFVRERYKSYNYSYDLYPNSAEKIVNIDRDFKNNSTNKIKVAILENNNSQNVNNKVKRDVNSMEEENVARIENDNSRFKFKRDISSYKNLLPELASALHSNLKTSKTDINVNHEEKLSEEMNNEEKRFDDDTVLPEFDMNKDLKEDKENEDNFYDYNEESNIMKIPPKFYSDQENTQDLSNILTMLKQSNFPENLQNLSVSTTTESSNTEPDFKLVFLLGLPANDNNSEIQNKIDDEAATYGDILQESFLDTYNNLTIKSVMMLKFVTNRCRDSVRYILKTDDDMYINMPNLIMDLRNRSLTFDRAAGGAGKRAEYLLLGDVMCNVRPVSDVSNKWFSPRYMYSGRVYPCYISGVAYAYSAPAATALYRAALKTPLFHLEDVYITGMCPLLSTPRIKPHNDPLFSYYHYGQLREPEKVICALHDHTTCHRVSAANMSAMRRAMANVHWVDRCERQRLTKVDSIMKVAQNDGLKPC